LESDYPGVDIGNMGD